MNVVLPFGKKRWEELKNKEKHDVTQSEKMKKKEEEMRQAEQDSKNLNKNIWNLIK